MTTSFTLSTPSSPQQSALFGQTEEAFLAHFGDEVESVFCGDQEIKAAQREHLSPVIQSRIEGYVRESGSEERVLFGNGKRSGYSGEAEGLFLSLEKVMSSLEVLRPWFNRAKTHTEKKRLDQLVEANWRVWNRDAMKIGKGNVVIPYCSGYRGSKIVYAASRQTAEAFPVCFPLKESIERVLIFARNNFAKIVEHMQQKKVEELLIKASDEGYEVLPYSLFFMHSGKTVLLLINRGNIAFGAGRYKKVKPALNIRCTSGDGASVWHAVAVSADYRGNKRWLVKPHNYIPSVRRGVAIQRRLTDVSGVFSVLAPPYEYTSKFDGIEKKLLFVMPYASSFVREVGKHSPSCARRIIFQLLSTVALMHQNGVVHGDLKLDNIVLDMSGTPRIIDFDLAVDRTAFAENELFCLNAQGTSGYLSPEAIDAKHRVHSLLRRVTFDQMEKQDAWALGLIIAMIWKTTFLWKKDQKRHNVREICYDPGSGLLNEKSFLRHLEKTAEVTSYPQSQHWLNAIECEEPDLVKGLLHPNINYRLSVQEALAMFGARLQPTD